VVGPRLLGMATTPVDRFRLIWLSAMASFVALPFGCFVVGVNTGFPVPVPPLEAVIAICPSGDMTRGRLSSSLEVQPSTIRKSRRARIHSLHAQNPGAAGG